MSGAGSPPTMRTVVGPCGSSTGQVPEALVWGRIWERRMRMRRRSGGCRSIMFGFGEVVVPFRKVVGGSVREGKLCYLNGLSIWSDIR